MTSMGGWGAAGLLQDSECLDDGGDAGLVIGPEDGVPSTPDHAVADDGLDTLSGLHGVEVGAQCDGDAWATREAADEVADAVEPV